MQSAKRRVIPIVVLCALAYTSYKSLVATRADPGILACNGVPGTSIAVSSVLLPTASEGWGKVMFSVCSQ